MVPPAGFEPAISALKGRRPGPLDDGGSRFSVGEGRCLRQREALRRGRWQEGVADRLLVEDAHVERDEVAAFA